MIDRRSFLKTVSAGTAALLLLPSRLARPATKQVGFKLDKAEKLKAVGGSTVLAIKGHDILFIRTGETEVRAFNPECTHQHCQVKYNPSTLHVECTCHGSAFDMTGKVLGGPAPAPLQVYPATLADDKVIVTVEE